ncbi:MAG TPA: FUSC family protein [Gemmatimonadaceae bacterium]|jgi:uncharacterized membrane protein YccC
MIGSGFVRRWTHDARVASGMALVRPSYAGGVRAAIATVAPIVFSMLVPLPAGAGTWMSLAGLNGAIVDRGGPYRMRAAMMSALAVASATAVVIGSLVGGHIVLAVFTTFLVALLCGLARGWVDVGPGFGVTVLVTFAIAVALPSADVHSAMLRGVFIIAGGAWAMLLAIVLWPLRPYRPVRLRVAECYRAIARYMEAAATELGAGVYDPATLNAHVVAVRIALDSARIALAISRRGRSVESGRGERLLVLHEVADQVFAHVIALLELSVSDPSTPSLEHERLVLSATLGEVAATMRALAIAIQSEIDLPPVVIGWNGSGMRAVNASMGEIVDRIADYGVAAVDLAGTLNSGAAPKPGTERIEVGELPAEPVLFSLDAITRPASVVMHHALRVAIVSAAAVAITELLHLNHGYWVTLTVVVILQPFAAMTRQKALQRVVGTILGGMVAAGLSALFQQQIAVLVLIAIFTSLCVALLPINYGAYAVFGTPAFVLLAESSAGDWHLAGLRIANTLIGGALALLGSQLLWPGEERNRLPELAATAIRANADFLRRAIAFVVSGSGDIGSLRDPRREVGNAALNAEDSFQRLMSEHRGRHDELEAMMATLIYVRRLAASTAALAIAASASEHPSPQMMRPFADAADAILTDVASALIEGRAPAPFPPIGSVALPDVSMGSVVSQRVVRLSRQLKLLHASIERWAAQTSVA